MTASESKTSPTHFKRSVVLLKQRLDRFGGLEKATRNLAVAFADAGCDVTVLTLGDVPMPWDSRIQLKSLGPVSKLSVLNLRRFDTLCRRWLSQHPADIIFGLDRNTSQTHYRAGNGVHAEYLLRRRATEPWLKSLSFSCNPLHRSLLNYEKAAFTDPHLRCIFVNSHMVAEEIRHHYDVDPARIKVSHNGIDLEQSNAAINTWKQERPSLLKEFDLPSDAYHLLFAGHGYRRKGLEYLLKGIAQLRDSNVHVSVVGRDRHVDKFRRLASELDIHNQVHFFGAVNDITPFFKLSDAIVIPSVYDPFANVTVEALAAGLYVVSSAYNGGKEVLTPNTGTVIAQLQDPESVAESLHLALQNPKTASSALTSRQSVENLDSKTLLGHLVTLTLTS